MNNKTAKLLIAVYICSAVPCYGRGGFGGFGGGRSGFDRGDFNRDNFGSSDRGSFGSTSGSADRGFGSAGPSHGWNGVSNYGSAGQGGGFAKGAYGGDGFGSIAGSAGGASGLAGKSNFGQFTGHNPSSLSSDSGFSNVAGRQNQFSGDHNNDNVDNSYNHSNTVNNYNNVNATGGYHSNYGSYGYHADGNYHPYGAYGYHSYGYHPYGYGYHPYYGGCFGYPGAWCGLSEASMWTFMGLSTMTSFLGIAALSSHEKASSNNVTYEGDNIYINSQPAQQYYQQSQQLAGTGASGTAYSPITAVPLNQQLAYSQTIGGQLPSSASSSTDNTDIWKPLGVYALVEPGQNNSTMLFQLAINKDGIVGGNYLNEITNEKAQIHGALDKKTRQISWCVGENNETVFDTTIDDLAHEKSKVVVQFGPSNTQQMSLIRQKPPKDNQTSDSSQMPTS